MNKKIIVAAVVIVVMCLLGILFTNFIPEAKAWGNKTWWDTTNSFEWVIIGMPDGTSIEGECEQWLDFDNSDMIQVKIGGKVYLTHSVNVVLISED